MSPKPENTFKVVYDYLLKANRPYSTNDLFLNLHKEHGKPAVQKAIDQLVSEEKLKVKLNGKQSCYFVNQDILTTCSEEELAGLESSCAQVESDIKQLNEQVRQAESRLKLLTSSPTDEEARTELGRLTKENTELRDRLSKLQNNQTVISAEDKANITKIFTTTVSQWKKRKRMATDSLDSILDGWPKTKKQLLEEIGVETDDAVGACMPDTAR